MEAITAKQLEGLWRAVWPFAPERTRIFQGQRTEESELSRGMSDGQHYMVWVCPEWLSCCAPEHRRHCLRLLGADAKRRPLLGSCSRGSSGPHPGGRFWVTLWLKSLPLASSLPLSLFLRYSALTVLGSEPDSSCTTASEQGQRPFFWLSKSKVRLGCFIINPLLEKTNNSKTTILCYFLHTTYYYVNCFSC